MENNFDVVAFKNGSVAINGLGQKVKYIIETRGKMLVKVFHRYGDAEIMKLNADGKRYTGTNTPFDLVSMK